MLALLDAGYSVTIFDNLDNSFLECFERMKKLAGPEKAAKMTFVKGDLRDAAAVDAALGSEKFDAVIHFAGRKAVGESVAEPMLYYTHNVAGTVNLIEAMRKHGVRNVSSKVFFSFLLLLLLPLLLLLRRCCRFRSLLLLLLLPLLFFFFFFFPFFSSSSPSFLLSYPF